MTSGAPAVKVTALLADVNSGVMLVEPTVTAMATWAPVESIARMLADPLALPTMLRVPPTTLALATAELLVLAM